MAKPKFDCDRRLDLYLPDWAADQIELLSRRYMVPESTFARALILQALDPTGSMARPAKPNGHLSEASH